MAEWHLNKGADDDFEINVKGSTAQINIPKAGNLIVTFAGSTIVKFNKAGLFYFTGILQDTTFNNISVSSGATIGSLIVSSNASVQSLVVTSGATIDHLNVSSGATLNTLQVAQSATIASALTLTNLGGAVSAAATDGSGYLILRVPSGS